MAISQGIIPRSSAAASQQMSSASSLIANMFNQAMRDRGSNPMTQEMNSLKAIMNEELMRRSDEKEERRRFENDRNFVESRDRFNTSLLKDLFKHNNVSATSRLQASTQENLEGMRNDSADFRHFLTQQGYRDRADDARAAIEAKDLKNASLKEQEDAANAAERERVIANIKADPSNPDYQSEAIRILGSSAAKPFFPEEAASGTDSFTTSPAGGGLTPSEEVELHYLRSLKESDMTQRQQQRKVLLEGKVRFHKRKRSSGNDIFFESPILGDGGGGYGRMP